MITLLWIAIIPWVMSTVRKIFNLRITKFESLVYGIASIGYLAIMYSAISNHDGGLSLASLGAFSLFICISMVIYSESGYSHKVKSHGIYEK